MNRRTFRAFQFLALMCPSSAMACGDIESICEQQRQVHEMNIQMAMEAQMAQAEADQAARMAEAAEARRPRQRLFTVGAVVWFSSMDGKPGVYVAAGEYSVTDATQVALSNCYHNGGNNCRIGFTWNGGFAAVASDPDGSLFVGIGDSKRKAGRAAIEQCVAAKKRCKVNATFDSNGTEFYVPQ